MKISQRWLSEWIASGLSHEELAETLTMAGLEIDGIEAVNPGLEGVVVGEILTVEPHPDADRLRVCTVAGDVEERTIVCGAANARAGLKTPLATLGTRLPGGLKIKPAKLRGVGSEGMLCSSVELGLGEGDEGIMELPDTLLTGAAFSDALGLDDHILEIDLTPNRGDCLSVRGLARELSALVEKPWAGPDMEPVPAVIDRQIEIHLDSPADCPRYVGRVIEAVNLDAPTPLWMIERLRRSGIRSLGITVDVTNYVLLELGQPMHAFDLDRLNGAIHVRRARAGEKFELLDGQTVTTEEDLLLIADEKGPLALAGIMGGQDSAVGDTTRDILLESAWFNPASISGRARRLGLATESSHRFERGVDPQLQRLAIERATALIIELAGGRPGPVLEALDEAHLPQPPRIALRLDRVNRLLGSALDAATVQSLLERLGMQVEANGDGHFQVTPPSARSDLALEIDLIEEVARVYGYDRLPTRHPGGEIIVVPPAETRLATDRLRQQLAARGFQEIIAWSFVSEAVLEKFSMAGGAQPLANPLSREMAVLRTQLLPGMVEVAQRNLHRQLGDFFLFELGHRFINRPEAGFVEDEHLGLLMTGSREREHFSGKPVPVDFFDLKGEVENLLTLNGVAGDLRFEAHAEPWLHPGQSARLLVDGQVAGWLGQLHPGLAEALGLSQPLFVAELALEAVQGVHLPVHHDSGRFPAVRRDIALVVADQHPADALLRAVREKVGKLLEDCVIFDQYRGPGIETGFRSLAIGLILRDTSRTLEDSEVDRLVNSVLTHLESLFEAKLRG